MKTSDNDSNNAGADSVAPIETVETVALDDVTGGRHHGWYPPPGRGYYGNWWGRRAAWYGSYGPPYGPPYGPAYGPPPPPHWRYRR